MKYTLEKQSLKQFPEEFPHLWETKTKAGLRNTLLKLFSWAGSRKSYLDTVAELLHKWVGCGCLGIRVMDEEGTIPYEAYRGFTEDFLKYEDQLSIKQDNCICTRVFQGKMEPQETICLTPGGSFHCYNLGQFVGEQSAELQKNYRTGCVRCGFACIAQIPISYRDKIIGTIHLTDKREGGISRAQVEFIESLTPLIGEAMHRFQLEEELQGNYDTQKLINAILSTSLMESNLTKLMQFTLDQLIALPWLNSQARGVIFLVEEDPHMLVMQVHRGLSEEIRKGCAKVPVGKCFCGQAALTGLDQHTGYDHIHELIDNERASHCHFAVPIQANGLVLGVLNLSLHKGHYKNQKVRGLLQTVARTLANIIELKKMEQKLHYFATHDFLTLVPNRFYLEETLISVVKKAQGGQQSTLLMVGLDNFKMINDSYGHAAGDQLIVALVNVIKGQMSARDQLFRFGGDEFVILLPETPTETVLKQAEKLRQLVEEQSFCLTSYGTCFHMSVSIGIVVVEGDTDPQQLLANVDAALYEAKERGRNRVVLRRPDEQMRLQVSETNQIIGLIKKALREDLFILYFQPVIEIKGRNTAHYEVLLRMQGPDGELLPPGKFIPVAERFGLMSQIDAWVVRKALEVLDQYPKLDIFINLSGVSMGDPSLLELIETTINCQGINPTRIVFEITETAAVKDMVRVERWIRRIKALGCRFALDDFGIGFSSFSYLRNLPVDYLKVDGSFVRNIDTDLTHRALVQTINTVAHTLGKKTIAEFVENEEVLRILTEMGIEYGQGYYLGRPGPNPYL